MADRPVAVTPGDGPGPGPGPDDGVAVRPVRDAEPDQTAELTAVAELRWHWVREIHGTPDVAREVFAARFVAWAREHASTHRCLVAVGGGAVVGMAWLAVGRRVPDPRRFARASGDVQSVYVVPERRDGGLGGRLIAAALECAGELGLERVTVHSSGRAVSAYARHGFAVSPRLLQTEM